MRWIDFVNRDPVPWLLDPENPSARLLTLRHIFKRPEANLERDYTALLAWEPVQAIIARAKPGSFWGREENPYFGGPIGTFGTLATLAQLSVPTFPQARAACGNLFEHGHLPDGRFAPQEPGPLTWLCYTGMALKILCHFGFKNDPRTHATSAALAHIVNHKPEQLTCKIAGGNCMAGTLKSLVGLLSLPAHQRTAEEAAAITALTEQLLDYPFDFKKREAAWLQLHFPRYYESDLLELCRVLASTLPPDHPRLQMLVKKLLTYQTAEGRWIKTTQGPSDIQVERPERPSRWLTFEAVHTLVMVYGSNTYAA